ncbi:MAG: hypothetical protein ACE5D3_00005, partial [Candidatus Binatia bacterium]
QDGDDANKGTNATTLVRSSPNRSGIGVLLRSAQGFYFNGALAHLVLWKGRGLDAVDAEALAKGAHPYTRAHGSLAHYYKLRGNGPAGTVVRDSVGGLHMNDVVGGTPTKAEEEPLIRNCFLQGCG